MIPLRDNVHADHYPLVNVALIWLNIVVFLYEISLGPHLERFLALYAMVPHQIFTGTSPAGWLPLLTSMFLHGGVMHLAGNMLFLWIFGNNVEDYFGSIKFLLFYLVSGFAAIALYTLFNPGSEVPLVGASGAIAGIMGAYLVLHPRAEITCLIVFFFIQFVVLPAKVVLGIWFGLQILMSLLGSSTGGGVAWLAHVGGFVFGYLILKALVKFRGDGNVSSGDRQRIYRMQW